MRLLERIVTTHPNLGILEIDIGARGARGLHIKLQPAGPAITGQFNIDDEIVSPAGGDIPSRIAIWHYDGVDDQQGSYIFCPLFGDKLQLGNQSGDSIQSFVHLYDEPPGQRACSYTRFFRANTLAALATFTSGDMAVGLFPMGAWAIETDRAADFFLDFKSTTAGTYIEGVFTANIPGAGGGVVGLLPTAPSPVFRVRIRNNDAALVMTYNITAYVQVPT